MQQQSIFKQTPMYTAEKSKKLFPTFFLISVFLNISEKNNSWPKHFDQSRKIESESLLKVLHLPWYQCFIFYKKHTDEAELGQVDNPKGSNLKINDDSPIKTKKARFSVF